ncbi:caspase family protein [Metabacillus fastidiosus]|uniref:Caspase family protein n=1 Tax=Metabacillus fastidiosus TaxID=1458 RepID=A0ABU6P5U4_9BACI|nr:caspase family protein [Metabacillus fastidiosus]
MSERYAILIGINDYNKAPLNYCVNDANAISDTLVNRCLFKENNIYKITSDNNNSIKEVLGAFRQALEDIKITFESHKDSFFFFFAGHGSCTDDKSKIWLQDLEYSIEDIYNEITYTLNPEVQIYLIDACESGGKVITRNKTTSYSLLEKYEATSSGTMLLFACGTNQYAKEYGELKHGLLTNVFLEGINNDDLYDADGFLTPSILQDYVTKETAKISDFTQIPVYENRISGVYPLAQKKISGSNDISGEITVRNRPIYKLSRDLRNNALITIKNTIVEKMDNIKHQIFKQYEKMYEVHTFEQLGFRELKNNYKNIDILSEKLFKIAKRDLNLPLNDVFQEIIIEDNNNSFASIFSRKSDIREYKLDLQGNSVDFRIDVFKAENITESSFGYGIIVYYTKWGISIATLEFRLEWDGYSDRIMKDIQTKTLKYKIADGLEDKVRLLNLEDEFTFITNITEWNENRRTEISAFLESSL